MIQATPREGFFVGGRWVQPSAGRTIAVKNPASGEVIAEIGYGSADDARSAVDAAAEAFAGWSALPARRRSDALMLVYDLLSNRADEIGLLEEAIARANRTEMGLAGYMYTGSLERSWRVSQALEVGILGLNNALPSAAFAPMGGVKQSGLGREGSHQGLEEFCELKNVALDI